MINSLEDNMDNLVVESGFNNSPNNSSNQWYFWIS